jgi:acetylglutamate kinase
MTDATLFVLFLDDYHGGDVLFIQNLARALSRKPWRPAPIVVHGSGRHAERLMEAQGIFRTRADGVLQIESEREHGLVDRALRSLNHKIVALLTDAIISCVGIVGAQRKVFELQDGRLHAPGAAWLRGIAEQGVVPVVAANARDVATSTTGEIALSQGAAALARGLKHLDEAVEIVFFTRTNLPGIMREGVPRSEVDIDDPALRESAADLASLTFLAEEGFSVLLTNSNRLADASGPTGSRILPIA